MHGRSSGRSLVVALLCGGALCPWLGCASKSPAPREHDGGRRVEASLYGNINKYAYYYAELLIGSPDPQRTSVIVDTGSHLMGFPCRGCVHCGDHIDPAFDFSRSTSAEWLNCSTRCDECSDGRCRYRAAYSEGSAVSGRWFEDVIHFEGPSGHATPVRAQLGCHMRESNLFLSQRADGIMGLAPTAPAPGGSSPPRTVLLEMFDNASGVDAAVFSLCLSTWGGRLTIGGFDLSYRSEGSRKVQWLHMDPSVYYVVYPTALMLEGLAVAIGPGAFGPTIIDSGTTFTSLPGPVYHNLVNDLSVYCGVHGCGAKPEGHACWHLSDMLAGPREFPTLRMQFAGAEVEWPPHAYLHQKGGRPDLWCYSFKVGRGVATILGISWMLHKDIIFDLQERRLGVVQTVCPQYGRPASSTEEIAMVAEPRSPPRWPRPAATAATAGPLLALAGTVALATVACRLRRTRHVRMRDLSVSRPHGGELLGGAEEAEPLGANGAGRG